MTFALLLLVDLESGAFRPVYPQYIAMILLHPLLLRWLFGIRLTGLQVLWISITLFLHPFGVVYGVYSDIWWFDHLTHALSASLVASIGYLVGRVIVFRSDGRTYSNGIALRLHLSTLLLVLIGGAFWEVYEVYQGGVVLFGIELTKTSLEVYGTEDMLYDYLFNLVGWFAVVLLGDRLLADAATDFARQVKKGKTNSVEQARSASRVDGGVTAVDRTDESLRGETASGKTERR